ncbi:class I SAM-dependent methyltransferase [Candidatus Woesebacteria bacterium]|nr:class I SAM-dependent methyltransferase [Candidatus Woesebacteria bacterium]
MQNWINFKKDGAKYSPTEEFGLSFIGDEHKKVLSVGISTAGFAEVRMALDNPQRKIVATTLDEKGIEFTRQLVKKYGLENQIELKIEDISADLDYQDKSFDFVYARLVLHYLPKEKLTMALRNIHKILKDDGKFFVVVRSYDWESEVAGASYDSKTGLTSYPNFDNQNNIIKTSTRNLQTIGSITAYLQDAGFIINSIELFSETIFGGYERVNKKKNRLPANLIAIYAEK